MTELEELSAFVDRAQLGAIGVAIAALTAPPTADICAFTDELGGSSLVRNFTGERYRGELQ